MKPEENSPRDVTRNLIKQATASDDGARIITDCCTALVASGLSMAWLSMAIRAIEPNARGINATWHRGERIILETDQSRLNPEANFKLSPIRSLLSEGRRFGRWRLDGSECLQSFPLLQQLRSEGITDYILHIVDFAPGTALVGVGIAIASDSLSGFSTAGLAVFEEVLPALALAVSKLSLSRTLRETLSVYLGPQTATRVLNGQIRRGEGENISAALLMTDLRAFTTVSECQDPLRVVEWLNEHFEALGEPISEYGGEILKFLGDGFLAIFPVSASTSLPCEVCEKALAAAQAAIHRNQELNKRRRLIGLPALEADIVLHFGRVAYGNVGTSRRLDFTIIGPAVNEASRIEKLCEETGYSLLISDSFMQRCNREFLSVGRFPLRGLETLRQIWTLPIA